MQADSALRMIGKNIQELRREKGIKGEVLGKHLSVSKSAISQMESGLIDFKVSTLLRIASALETDITSIVTLIKEESGNQSDNESSRSLRVIDILVCRIEYLNEQIECMRQNKGVSL